MDEESMFDIDVFPAGAGVILSTDEYVSISIGFPRRCGGDPGREIPRRAKKEFSPQVRG